METIDQKVKKVLELERVRITKANKDFENKAFVIDSIDDCIQPEYTLSPRDTIGKNIYFNTVRR